MIKPFKLAPSFKDYIWGGSNLKEKYFKDTPFDITAESWELSCHKNGECAISGGEFDGKTLSSVIKEFKDMGIDITGKNAEKFYRFPVLIKLIDAKDDLSVQVHPNDDYAKNNENGSYGKTEVWYVVEAEENAKLVYGMNRDMTKSEFLESVKTNTLTECLNFVDAKRGDVFFVEAGTVHAIGKGLLICEIQQNSDTTYRVYDWGRVDKNGNARELHVEKAADVSRLEREEKSDFSPKLSLKEEGIEIFEVARCKYFTVKKYSVDEYVELKTTCDTFLSVTFLSGEGSIVADGEKLYFKKGESFYVPAQDGKIEILGKCEFLETTV